ncbi:MAG: molybdopterin dinucleotide binding domain-containing protein [Nitrospirales bacterium]
MWGTWIEINPQTARSYGVRQGELVQVTSPYGSCEAPLVLFPGIRPDVIAMPIGQGHRTYGRYAKDRGVNPLSLLAPAFDSESGALAMGSTRVRIQGTGRTGRLVLLEHGNKNGSDELITIDRHKG